jgi:uncharacterized membrane protein
MVEMMNWNRNFRLRERIRGSLWLVPLLATVIGALLGTFGALIEKHTDLPSFWHYSPSTASSVLTSIVGATAALTGFVVTVSVLVVQTATGTFSARYMRLWYRDRLLKATLAAAVFTLAFSFALLQRVEQNDVPNLGVTVSGLLVSVSLLIFIFFFDRSIHRQRPVAAAAQVAREARKTFTQNFRLADRPDIRWGTGAPAAEPALAVRAREGGAVQAFDLDGLVTWARKHGAEVVLAEAVGDFVQTGGVLMRIYGEHCGDSDEAELHDMVALGDERTFEQDPGFAIRILVDIAIRALSPAVNDPTTAVQCIDYLGEVLGLIGTTDLKIRTKPASDETPAAVVMVTRRWEDFLLLGFTEIREYGASSVQVMRKLKALLGELRETVRPEHRAAVEDELRRLEATVVQAWGDSIDLDLAGERDRQGIGGPSAGAVSG